MYISINWLNYLLRTDQNLYSLTEFENTLGLGGFEIDDFEIKKIFEKKNLNLKLAITTNRSDVLSFIGLSRELHFLLKYPWSKFKFTYNYPCLKLKTFSNELKFFFKNNENLSCEDFKLIFFQTKNSIKSPRWMQRRLETSQIPVTNTIEDLTNYVMIEWGQPFQLFDVDKLNLGSQNLISLTNINQKDFVFSSFPENFSCTSNTLVYTVNEKIVGIADLLTKNEYKINKNSKNILICIAKYKVQHYRKSIKSIGLQTQASIRHERKVGYSCINFSIRRIITLLKLNEPNAQINFINLLDSQDEDIKTNQIRVCYKNVRKTLGKLDSDSRSERNLIKKIINNLGLLIFKDSFDYFIVIIPSHRREDLQTEIDIIEEIARGYGFNKILKILPASKLPGKISKRKLIEKKVRQFYITNGFFEVIHSSFNTFNENSPQLLNPLSNEYCNLRTNLIYGILNQTIYNLKQKNSIFDCFEFGSIFYQDDYNHLLENYHIAGLFGGKKICRDLTKKTEIINWYEAKGKIESLFKILNINFYSKNLFSSSKNYFHPNLCVEFYSIENKFLGLFGLINPLFAKKNNLPSHLFIFELDFEKIIWLSQFSKKINYQKFSIFPEISIDLSLIVKNNITYSQILDCIKNCDTKNLISINIFDSYQDENQRINFIGIKLSFRSFEKTLKKQDIEEILEKIKNNLYSSYSIQIR